MEASGGSQMRCEGSAPDASHEAPCNAIGMRDMLVLTILGADRTGLVESVARTVAAVGGNWEESRMARLAGQFAGILLVTVEAERARELEQRLRELASGGLTITVQSTTAAPPLELPRLRLELTGQDRPGIVRDVARVLAEQALNVEELETEVESAPMSGEHMFRARIWLRAPHGVNLGDVRARLEALTSELMVDLSTD